MFTVPACIFLGRSVLLLRDHVEAASALATLYRNLRSENYAYSECRVNGIQVRFADGVRVNMIWRNFDANGLEISASTTNVFCRQSQEGWLIELIEVLGAPAERHFANLPFR